MGILDMLPYEKRNHYPHMKPADIEIWERFIDKNPNAYLLVTYDYWVGSPPPFNPIVNEETQGSADGLYRKKIDVVGFTKDQIDVIEIKPNAGNSAIGQVKGYAFLYKRDEKPKLPVQPVIITNQINNDLVDLAEDERVELKIA